MPIGHRAHLDRYIPAAKRGTHYKIWGWSGLVRRDANITELPSLGRPLYGQAARNEVKRIQAWARRLQRYLGPITRRHFRDVMASIRPLRYDTWASAKEYLARCERERAAALAAGQPWPPKGRSNTKPRINATPSSAT